MSSCLKISTKDFFIDLPDKRKSFNINNFINDFLCVSMLPCQSISQYVIVECKVDCVLKIQ